MPEKKKKKRILPILLPLLLLILLGGAVAWFGFIDHDSSIRIREYLAEKQLENGKAEKAIALYENILSIDPGYEEAYLRIAAIHLRKRDTGSAKEVLFVGLEECKSSDIAEKLWEIYQKEALAYAGEDQRRDLIQYEESIPEDELSSYMDEEDAQAFYAADAEVWTNAYLELAGERLEAGDATGSLKLLEKAMDQPLNTEADTDSLLFATIDPCLALAGHAVDTEAFDEARSYYERVLQIDPANQTAIDGLIALNTPEEEPLPTYVSISGKALIDLEVNLHGLRFQLPVTIDLDAVYDGNEAGQEQARGDARIEYSLLGSSENENISFLAAQNGSDISLSIKNNDQEIVKDQKLTDTQMCQLLKSAVEKYQKNLDSHAEDGEELINNERCRTDSLILDGQDIIQQIPGGLLDIDSMNLIKGLNMKLTYYSSKETRLPVKADLELLSINNDAVNSFFTKLIGDTMGATITLNSFTMTVDVKYQ